MERRDEKRPTGNTIDLGEIGRHYDVELKKSERTEDREARLKRESDDANHKRRIEMIAFLFVLIVVSVLIGYCCYLAASPSMSADDRKWATTLLFSIGTGVMGIFVGIVGGRATR